MTKLSYDIQYHGRTVKNVPTYNEAKKIVAELGGGWSYKARYTKIYPNETEEIAKAKREHAEKVTAIMACRRKLAKISAE